jgi:circadian clock protein KaiC
VVLDSVSSFESAGTRRDSLNMLMRLIDQLKARQISTMMTSLTASGEDTDRYPVGVSSLIDGWIQLRNIEQAGERTRALHVLKARGIRHSNQVRELLITDNGLKLEEIHMGPEGILVGSARFAQQLRDTAAAQAVHEDLKLQKDMLARKHTAMKARIAELEGKFVTESQDIEQAIARELARQETMRAGRRKLGVRREQVPSAHRRRAGGAP